MNPDNTPVLIERSARASFWGGFFGFFGVLFGCCLLPILLLLALFVFGAVAVGVAGR